MKRLSVFIGFVGLMAGSNANGQNPSQTVVANVTSEQIISGEQTLSGWAVDKTKSTLGFSGKQSGAAFTGSFGDFEASINFDPDNVAAANVAVTIIMNSATTDDSESTNALPGEEWFDVKKFPVAKFEASDFKHLQDDKYEAKGNLTIRNVTQKIVLPFKLKIENKRAIMDAQLSLDRTAYKVGTGMWASKDWVEHDIVVDIHLEAAQIEAAHNK
ncbi:MAG: YceI family protein [Robiginitomaculum sp.]|nr:YceI family protein [Robiginitomaculum sp.]